MIKVLFVCLGNICRSTMAEGVFKHKVREMGLEHAIQSDSAGTGHWHIGEPPHPKTMQMLAQKGITDYSHRARLLLPQDIEHFDYILTMDESNYEDVMAFYPNGEGKVRRFLEFAPEMEALEVPDPYYNGRYEEVYHLVFAASGGLLNAIREKHVLP